VDALDLTVLVDGAALTEVPGHWGDVQAFADIDDDGDTDYVVRWAYQVGPLSGGAHAVESHFSLAYPITDGFDFDGDGEPDEYSGSWDYDVDLRVGGCVTSLHDEDDCVPSGSAVRLTTQWYVDAVDDATAYLDALDLTVEVDDAPLPDVADHWSAAEVCGDLDEDGDARYVTRWAYPLDPLADGAHTFDSTFSLAYPVTDGFDFDGDGEPDEFSGTWGYTVDLQVGGCTGALQGEAGSGVQGLSPEPAVRIEPARTLWVYLATLQDALAEGAAPRGAYLPVRLRR
jgi:hypothetical protein